MEEQKNPIRLNKYLSEAGICSRREADRLIDEGKITVDGKVAVMGQQVTKLNRILVNQKSIKKEEEIILIAVNKPVGIVCTAQKKDKDNIVDFIGYPKRIYPVGRLDKDSNGLILMTNQGDLVNKMMRSGNMHEKEYVVTVNKEITRDFVRNMSKGVPILETITRKCNVDKIGKYQFRIILTQGLNRQIRRMCEYFGYQVIKLERIRIMNITLGNLKEGKYRKVTGKEYDALQKLIASSSNETVKVKNRPEKGMKRK